MIFFKKILQIIEKLKLSGEAGIFDVLKFPKFRRKTERKINQNSRENSSHCILLGNPDIKILFRGNGTFIICGTGTFSVTFLQLRIQ